MRERGARAGTVLAASALCSSLGCVQILGLHDRTDENDAGLGGLSTDGGNRVDAEAGGSAVVAGTCGSLHHASASCASCMDQSCCDEATACAGDGACEEAADCLVNCATAACRARCGVFYTHPDTLIALRACRTTHCAAECGSSCGEFASSNDACHACRQASCCAQATACAKNVACGKLDLCRSNCTGSQNCPADCNSQYPEGVDDYTAWTECVDQQCSAQCQPGQDWACLDQPIIWPHASADGKIAFSVTLVDLLTEKPYAGALVKACEKFDFQCTQPQAVATSDPTGRVNVMLTAGTSGFDGYFDITGGQNGDGSGVFPAIWYPEPRIVADGWRGTFQFISADAFSLFGGLTQTTIDPNRGHFAANASDCDFTGAPTVSFSANAADDKTKPFYFVGDLPATTAMATDQSAIGGFVNLPAGAEDGGVGGRLVLVTATSGAAGGKALGSLSVIIRPGTFTTTSFPPVP